MTTTTSTTTTVSSSRNSGATSVWGCSLLLLSLFNVVWMDPLATTLAVDASEGASTIPTAAATSTGHNHYPSTCHHLKGLYYSHNNNMSAVHQAVQAADDFHANGGSLAAVQEYLDEQIAPTLERLGISYQPTTKKNNNNKNKTNDPLPAAVDDYLRQYYATHRVPRGGYGQPLPVSFQNKRNGKVHSTALHRDRVQDRWMDVMETWSHQRFQVAVGPSLPPCPHMATFSEGTYEAKNFCVSGKEDDDDDKHKANDKDDCHIFSIGSNDQWGFEEELLQKLPDCHVHTFDCTLKDNTPRRKPNDPKVHFYPHCVSSKDATTGGKYYKTYIGLVEATGIQHPPKVLKMDIEGFEFDVLSSMLKSPSTLWPEQIMMEVHFASRMIDLSWLLRTRQTAEMTMFFDLLYNKGGYMPAHIKHIDGCPTCMEILLVRVHCI